MAVTFSNLNSEAGLKKLDDYLLTRSYITGYQASKDDITVYSALSKAPSSEYVNVCRWYKHIDALLRISGVSDEGQGVNVEDFASAIEEPVATPPVADSKPAADVDDDDDDDVDLFGEETEEEKKAAEERAAAIKASGKKKESGKSSVLLDVKPWDDETDMKKLEEAVRNVHMEGLVWGASKLVPVGFGIKKLQIMLTIVDDLVSIDELIEDYLTAEPANEYIQSCDIVAFNKISQEYEADEEFEKCSSPLSFSGRSKMLVLQSFKCKILLIIFVLAFVACYNLHLFSDSIHTKERQGLGELTSEKSDDEKQQILKVLEKATAQDRTVIITAVNHAWAAEGSILDLFLESFRIGEGTERLLDHLLIVAMDQQALERCNSIHPHCYFLATPGVDFAPEQPFMTPNFLKLVWRKNEFLQVVLELGYNFIFTDPDIMWLRNPLPHLNGIDEIIIASDYYMGEPMDKGNWASAGLKFVKSDESTIDFYKLWRMVRTLYPNESDQTTFEIIKHTFYVNLRIRHVDTLYFGGFCQLSRDMNKICTVHANCCVDLQSKLHDLRLVLDDWKNFTRASSEQKESLLNSSLSPWRAPSKCST